MDKVRLSPFVLESSHSRVDSTQSSFDADLSLTTSLLSFVSRSDLPNDGQGQGLSTVVRGVRGGKQEGSDDRSGSSFFPFSSLPFFVSLSMPAKLTRALAIYRTGPLPLRRTCVNCSSFSSPSPSFRAPRRRVFLALSLVVPSTLLHPPSGPLFFWHSISLLTYPLSRLLASSTCYQALFFRVPSSVTWYDLGRSLSFFASLRSVLLSFSDTTCLASKKK